MHIFDDQRVDLKSVVLREVLRISRTRFSICWEYLDAVAFIAPMFHPPPNP